MLCGARWLVPALFACLSVFVTLSAAAQGSGSGVPRFLIVDYNPVSKTPAPNSNLYDYVYRVDVRNAGATVASLLGRVASKRKTVTVLDAEATFLGVEAQQVKASSDTITVRAHKHFDRRLDKKVLRNGKLVFEEGGVDPDDKGVPGMPRAWDDLGNLALDNLFLLKSFHVFEWTFEATVSSGPPQIASQSPAGLVNTAQPTIAATTSDPDGDLDTTKTVLKLDGTDVTSQAQVTASGVSYTPSSPLGQGAHTVTLTVGDAANNATTATWFFTVDTVAPTVVSYSPRDTSIASPGSVIAAQYADATAGVNPASVVLRVDGVDVTALATVGALDVSFKPAAALSQGIHTVALHLEDHAGNVFDHTWSFGVDSSGPTIANAQPKDVVLAADALPTISASLADSGAGVNVSSVVMEVDGAAVVAQVSTTAVSYTPAQALTEGAHTVKVRAADANNNASELVWSFITRSLPTITQMTPKDVIVGSATTLVISAQYADVGSGIDVTKTVLKVDGVDFTAQAAVTASGISFTPASALPQGLRIVQLTVVDLAGNAYSETWRYMLDTGAPVISDQAPKNTLIANQTPTITAAYQDTGLDGSGIDTSKVKLLVDGVDVTASATVTGAQVTYVPTPPLATGLHTMVLTVADLANNTTESTWSFVVDAEAASITLVTPEGLIAGARFPTIGATVIDQGAAGVDLNSLRLSVDGVDVTAAATVGVGGRITYTPSVALTEGAHVVELRVSDTAGNPASKTWSFSTIAPPVVEEYGAVNEILRPGKIPVIWAQYEDFGAGISAQDVSLKVDGVDVTASTTRSDFELRYSPASPPSLGIHQVELRVADRLGNVTQRNWTFRVAAGPTVSSLTPSNVTYDFGQLIVLEGEFAATDAPIKAGGVRLFLDGQEVTASSAILGGRITFVANPPTALGAHSIWLSVVDENDAETARAAAFEVLPPAQYVVEMRSPADGAVIEDKDVDVRVEAASSRSVIESVEINGRAARSEFNEAAQRLQFIARIPLVRGPNAVQMTARFADGQSRTVTASIVSDGRPSIVVATPADHAVLGAINPSSPRDLTGNVERPVSIQGTVDKPVVSVSINQQAAQLEGQSFRFDNFFLHEGTNLLTVVATDSAGRVGTSSLTVYVDQTAPIVVIEAPNDRSITSGSRVAVRGLVNDAVEGGVNVPYPAVNVRNTSTDEVSQALVSEKYFAAYDVPLAVGENVLKVIATDNAGNARERELRVTRIAVGSARLTKLTGDRQQGPADQELPKALAVVAIDKDGNPLSDLQVTFDITRGTGSLAAAAGGTPTGELPKRNLAVRTDSAGRAQVWLTIGKQSGEAGNAVRVYSASLVEDVVFTATTLRGKPAFLLAEGTGTQYVEAGTLALEALSALVIDANRNPVPGVPVTFIVAEGAASFDGSSSITVHSDKHGRSVARPLMGGAAEIIEIATSARDPSAPESPAVSGAVFQLTSVRSSTGPTRFSGKVLDHRGVPVPGVLVSIVRTALLSTTDSDGAFRFEEGVPPGKIDLFLDGRAARDPSGQPYPSMHFEMVAVRGQNNQVPHPIYLPPLLMSEARVVGRSEDVVLRIPGFEGFEMRVKANSTTFPDGSRTGSLVVSPVHVDRLPMVPPGGGSNFMAPAWTIQPSGVRFDPPVEVRIPNSLNLAPGERRELVQWDHDLATFVPIGSATVNEDGSLLITDAGSGITKAGWGGCSTCPPPPPPVDKCSTNAEAPQLISHELKTFNLEKRLGFLWDVEVARDPDRLRTNQVVMYRAKLNAKRCGGKDTTWFEYVMNQDGRQYEWNPDDGTDIIKTGSELRHKYKPLTSSSQRDRSIYNKYTCKWASCQGGPQQLPFEKTIGVKLRNGFWQEYVDNLTDCGWNVFCWIGTKIQEDLGLALDFVKGMESSLLVDEKEWNKDVLNQLGAGGPLSDATIVSLAVLYAANEAVFPESVLDINPHGKAVRAVKLAKKAGATHVQLKNHSEAVAQVTQQGQKIPWKDFENKLNDLVRAKYPEPNYTFYKPTRKGTSAYDASGSNGFDGVLIGRGADGKPAIILIEAKSGGHISVDDMSSISIGKTAARNDRIDANAFTPNQNVLADLIEQQRPSSLSAEEAAKLVQQLREGNAVSSVKEFILGHLPGAKIDGTVQGAIQAKLPQATVTQRITRMDE